MSDEEDAGRRSDTALKRLWRSYARYVMTSQGRTLGEAIRAIGVAEAIYHRWRNEFGGLKLDQVRRLKELDLGNSRLRRAVLDFTLDKQILAEALRGD